MIFSVKALRKRKAIFFFPWNTLGQDSGGWREGYSFPQGPYTGFKGKRVEQGKSRTSACVGSRLLPVAHCF